jgi:hypothetical protein
MKPTVFYKYTTRSTAELILRNGRLRWSSPTVFNDLAEFQRMPRFEPTVSESYPLLPQALIDAASKKRPIDQSRLTPKNKEVLRIFQEAIFRGTSEAELLNLVGGVAQSHADETIEQGLRDYFEALGPKAARVLCLTSTFHNEVMWGTYAESHYGCVLGFKAALVDSPFHDTKAINYSDTPAIVGSGLDFLLYGDSQELRQRTIEAVLYTKKSEWSYEQEWRLITWRHLETEATHGDYIFYPEELESITFGARTDTEFVESICTVAKNQYPTTDLYRMTHHLGDMSRVQIA